MSAVGHNQEAKRIADGRSKTGNAGRPVSKMEIQGNEPAGSSDLRRLSHDLRTPLTSIMGFAELLLEDVSIQGQTREYLLIIAEESKKLADILEGHIAENESAINKTSQDNAHCDIEKA